MLLHMQSQFLPFSFKYTIKQSWLMLWSFSFSNSSCAIKKQYKTHVWIVVDWICLLKFIHVVFFHFFIFKIYILLFRWVHILLSHYKVIKCFLSWVFVSILNICSWKALRWVQDVTNNTCWCWISHSGIEYCCCCSN